MASVLDAVKYYQQSIEKHTNDEEKVSMVIPTFKMVLHCSDNLQGKPDGVNKVSQDT